MQPAQRRVFQESAEKMIKKEATKKPKPKTLDIPFRIIRPQSQSEPPSPLEKQVLADQNLVEAFESDVRAKKIAKEALEQLWEDVESLKNSRNIFLSLSRRAHTEG
jgi:hypothetical protein